MNLQPVALQKPSYNPKSKVLTLQPDAKSPNVNFKDIGFIKFGNSKTDQNFCDQTTFQYVVKSSDVTNDHQWTYTLTSKAGGNLLPDLVAVFKQMDDAGTLNVEITTQDDFDSKYTKLYAPPADAVFNPKMANYFPTQDKLTTKLSKYLKINGDDKTAFNYQIYKDTADSTTLLWWSDPSRLYISDFFVLDSGVFVMNQDEGFDQPLIGMGERAGDLFYKNQNGAIHSRKTFDQANPIDDGLPPGRNMYGYQPLYAFQSNNG